MDPDILGSVQPIVAALGPINSPGSFEAGIAEAPHRHADHSRQACRTDEHWAAADRAEIRLVQPPGIRGAPPHAEFAIDSRPRPPQKMPNRKERSRSCAGSPGKCRRGPSAAQPIPRPSRRRRRRLRILDMPVVSLVVRPPLPPAFASFECRLQRVLAKGKRALAGRHRFRV